MGGVMGSSAGYNENTIARAFTRLGGRAVVFNRRGHGGVQLTRPRYNLFGDYNDLQEVVTHINTRFPNAKVIILGLSAGASLATSYLGEFGTRLKDSNVIGGVSISPVYDISYGLANMHPWYNARLASELRDFWSLQHSDLKGDAHLHAAATTQDHMKRHAKWTGCKDYEEYLERFNPENRVHNVKLPLLVISSEDDPVCVWQNAVESMEKHLDADIPACIVSTKRGSHIAWFGLWGQSCLTEWVMDYCTVLCQSAIRQNPQTGDACQTEE